MERRIQFSLGEYYHVYNRGVDKRKIYLSKKDYERFAVLLYLMNQEESVNMRDVKKNISHSEYFELPRLDNRLVSILSYCMMPNHFHLLLKEETENGVSKFMLKLQTAYSMYFNIRNDRSGALFQGTFKAEHVDDDNYLTYLFSYIHTNPVKILVEDWKTKEKFSKKEIEEITTFPYSSTQEYLGVIRPESKILTREGLELSEKNYKVEDILDLWLAHRNIDK